MPKWKYREYSTQYLANAHPLGDKEFHNLAHENDASFACQIDEIIECGHDQPYKNKLEVKTAGYVPCQYCMPGESKTPPRMC